ncbi:Cell division control protein 6-like protein B [Raphanus sativus]|nr:cell division control protein 6 homolog [Raphanus sativus]KAJ4915263.1 Cell division control protein 6-like protein B [Raphanus sativus]
MPTIAGSEKSKSIETPRKRKLRSEEANHLSKDTTPTPKKLKSRRRIAVSNLRTPEKEVKKDSNENLAVDNLSDCLDSESNWNPRDEEQMRAVKEALHVSKTPSTIVCREDEQRRIF